METAAQKDYTVQLEAFEGPLDLLLHLIRKEDIDIYNIPISMLLRQYLDYLNLAHELDIDLAGEFLEMASELTYIKSKMLLPEPPLEEEEGPDPRADLVAKLLEYQRYKMAAQTLLKKPLLGKETFRRAPENQEEDPFQNESNIETDLMSLLSAFQNVLKRAPKDQAHEISRMRMGVSEKILELVERLQRVEQIVFEDLFANDITREELVTTFLSILEMAKQRLIRIIQDKVFEKIYVVSLLSNKNLEEGETLYGIKKDY